VGHYRGLRQAAHGISLIETIVVLAIMSILATVTFPSLLGWAQSYRAETAVSQLTSHLALARAAAIARGDKVAVTPLAAYWHEGWRVHLDPNSNGRWDQGEEILATQVAVPGVVIRANGSMQHYVLFEPIGRPAQANGAFLSGSFTVCGTSILGSSVLVMSATGRVRHERRPGSTCATSAS
jgi:type IV fimbrial biogenesis protein FimT